MAEATWRSASRLVRIGVSSCLLGNEVRWDGGHKRNAFIADTLADFVDWVPVCPELELGLGVPRPPVRIVQPVGTADEWAQRLVERDSHRAHTTRMRTLARRRVKELASLQLCGFVLKQGSPSCGMERVEVWGEGLAAPRRSGRGFFARALLDRMPLLPVEEEGRLSSADVREAFIERVFAYQRLQAFFEDRWTVPGLAAFHTAHELQLLAHDERRCRALGRLVAGTVRRPGAALRDQYRGLFMQALASRATRGKHTNVLQHAFGQLRGRLDAVSRAELGDLIEDYRRARVPLIVPITLMRHHARAADIGELRDQLYLEPHPEELMLRNRV
jgi:uncharacterized protein YbbK (DUF523 family)/uncharacterized protein YbgA (DUF1722 family)